MLIHKQSTVARQTTDSKGKFYFKLVKCTGGGSSNFMDLAKKHYVIKTNVANMYVIKANVAIE